MTKGELLRNGLTLQYHMLSSKVLKILNAMETESRLATVLEVKDREALGRAKILVDKMRAWSEFVEDACEKKMVKIEEKGYINEGMALSDIISDAYPKTIFLGSKFFENISKSLWLLVDGYLIDESQLKELYMFFEKFQEELSTINNAKRYGVSIL